MKISNLKKAIGTLEAQNVNGQFDQVIKKTTIKKLIKGILSSIENNSKRLAGTTVSVTPKQYDEIVQHKEFYNKLLVGRSDFEDATGYTITSIEGFTKEFPLFGTTIMVGLEKVD